MRPLPPARVLVALGLLAAGLAAATSLLAAGGVPHVTDEVAYTLQARLFAHGMRAGPPADNASMMVFPFWEIHGASYAVFPPGWPALLAVGEAAGLAWLVNPLLVALLPALAARIARHLDAPPGRAALVAALSPAAWVMASSRMAHTSVLVALGVALVAVLDDGPRRRLAGAVAGAAVGYVVLARPFDAFLLGGPILVVGLLRRRGAAGLIVMPALATTLLLYDNAHLTGDPLRFPVNVFLDRWLADRGRVGCNRLGFGPDVGCALTFGTWGHTPLKALRFAGENLRSLDRLFLGLPGGLALAAWGAWRLRRPWPLLAMLALVVGYGLYWSPGRAYGARFYHPMLLVLPALAAAGIEGLPRAVGRWAPGLLVAAAAAGGSGAIRDLADAYWCVDDGLVRLLDEHGIREGVVFLDERGTRPAAWPVLGGELVCDPMMTSGEGLALTDPTRTRGGLQVRHALPDPEQERAYLELLQPGAPAWRVVHDIPTGRRAILQVAP